MNIILLKPKSWISPIPCLVVKKNAF